jgi:Flp pilus assembly protein TadB
MGLASDDERERAATSLREHFVRGRLTVEELAERVELALRARSHDDLRSAFDGLPRRPGRAVAATVVRGAAAVLLTGAWLVFSFALLFVFALTLLIHGATAVELAAFLVVWLVPTYLLWRVWRGAFRHRHSGA